MEDQLQKLKVNVHCLLISSQSGLTVQQFLKDYKESTGESFPFSKFGFKTPTEFLLSMPDVVMVSTSWEGELLTPVEKHKSKTAHINKLVLEQKNTRRRPVRRQPPRPFQLPAVKHDVCAPPPLLPPESHPLSIRGWEKNANKLNHMQQPTNGVMSQFSWFDVKTCQPYMQPSNMWMTGANHRVTFMSMPLPHFSRPQQMASRVDYPQQMASRVDCPQQRASRDDCPQQRASRDDCPQQIVSRDDCPQQIASRDDCPQQIASRDDCPQQMGNRPMELSNGPTRKSLELKQETEVEASQRPPFLEDEEVVSNWEDNASFSNFSTPTRTPTPEGKSNTSFISCHETAGDSSDHISERMKDNFKLILKKHRKGVLVSKLPSLYQKMFGASLDHYDLGYQSMRELVMSCSDIFKVEKSKHLKDWFLYDANCDSDSTKSGVDSSDDEPGKWVPNKILQNLAQLTEKHPEGISGDHVLQLYQDEFNVKIDLKKLGFDSMVSFLVNCPSIECRNVDDKCFIFPNSWGCKNEEAESAPDPLLTMDNVSFLWRQYFKEDMCDPLFRYKKYTLPEEAMFKVMVVDVVNPTSLWIQDVDQCSAFNEFMFQLNTFYDEQEGNYLLNESVIKPGQACCAKFSHNDRWHRAFLQSKLSNDKALVQYIDYGTTEIVYISNLRGLHKKFSDLPIQALRAKLYDLAPVEGSSWPENVSQYLYEIVAETVSIAEIVNVDREEPMVEIILINTTMDQSEDIIINELFKNNGMGRSTLNAAVNAECITNEEARSEMEIEEKHFSYPECFSKEFSVWGTLKSRVYSVPSNDRDQLTARIQEVCEEMGTNRFEIQRATTSVLTRSQLCVREEGVVPEVVSSVIGSPLITSPASPTLSADFSHLSSLSLFIRGFLKLLPYWLVQPGGWNQARLLMDEAKEEFLREGHCASDSKLRPPSCCIQHLLSYIFVRRPNLVCDLWNKTILSNLNILENQFLNDISAELVQPLSYKNLRRRCFSLMGDGSDPVSANPENHPEHFYKEDQERKPVSTQNGVDPRNMSVVDTLYDSEHLSQSSRSGSERQIHVSSFDKSDRTRWKECQYQSHNGHSFDSCERRNIIEACLHGRRIHLVLHHGEVYLVYKQLVTNFARSVPFILAQHRLTAANVQAFLAHVDQRSSLFQKLVSLGVFSAINERQPFLVPLSSASSIISTIEPRNPAVASSFRKLAEECTPGHEFWCS